MTKSLGVPTHKRARELSGCVWAHPAILSSGVYTQTTSGKIRGHTKSIENTFWIHIFQTWRERTHTQPHRWQGDRDYHQNKD